MFLVSAARPAPDWRSSVVLDELTDQAWFPTTIAKAGGQLLVVS